MSKQYKLTEVAFLSIFTFISWVVPLNDASAQRVSLIVHLRGIFESNTSLLSLTGNGTFRLILEAEGIQSDSTVFLEVAAEHPPGEFVLRFDYKENQTSTPYPSEKRLLIGSQNLELWVNPKYCNNQDSTYFQPGELENTTYLTFAEESFRQKEKIALLQEFLMNYDVTRSKFYKQGIHEYEKRRQSYNQWLTGKMEQDRELFASRLYWFQYIPAISMGRTETDRLKSMIDHYFDGADLSDPSIIRTSQLTGWIETYVNMHGQMATSVALRDSLFPEAARKAIDQARKGHPEVYGWMVDYFYRGFEVNNIPAGMKVLEPHLNDPACLTSKRKEIERRLEGMKTLVAGYRQWTHLRAEEGVRSKVAADYFILSTPQMILLDAGTKNIIGLPENLPEIKSIFQLETTTANLELP